MTQQHNNKYPLRHHAHRVIAALDRSQLDYIDKLSKDALFSCGTKLTRTEILSALVNVVRRLAVTGEGISSKEELEATILSAMRRLQGGNPS